MILTNKEINYIFDALFALTYELGEKHDPREKEGLALMDRFGPLIRNESVIVEEVHEHKD